MATWHVNDLTAATGALAAGVPPATYVFDAQGAQHVVYACPADSHVHELWWNTSGWHHHDLSAATYMSCGGGNRRIRRRPPRPGPATRSTGQPRSAAIAASPERGLTGRG